ncbi:DUF2799 domain-containing protein [Veronia pacifica]|uniref:DUF2799 domain-containing protein n=1 Tax=Veronia pacifica TaxID=1080227 RepID=A0A1C3EKW5_9GAMM|nr:DUF2799 domain-containing protein [Veronia pacifica]ODA33876.1 hypothetical protein A8L45_08615 [Veronia pacifica]
MKSKALPMCIILAATISGCAAISEEECRLGDWYQIGLKDGSAGQQNKAADYSKDCSEYSVKVDLSLYNKGRNDGLRTYCTYENGVMVGQANQSYNKVCPAELSTEFLAGYTPNYRVARLESQVQSLQSSIDDDKIRLLNPDLSAEDKANLHADINRKQEELKRADSELTKAKYQLKLHEIQRQRQMISKEMVKPDLSVERKAKLKSQDESLAKEQGFYEGLLKVTNTAETIKSLTDLF